MTPVLTGSEDLEDLERSVTNVLDVMAITRWYVADITRLFHDLEHK